jgi:hypothetical protein
MKDQSPNVRAEEAEKLLRFEVHDLYATLGAQLLVSRAPSRAAGIVSYIAAVRGAAEARAFHESLASSPSLREWGVGLGMIYDLLLKEGSEYFAAVAPELRKSLCGREEVLRLADRPERPNIEMFIMLVSGILRVPRELDSICTTIVAILFRRGMRNFCAEKP